MKNSLFLTGLRGYAALAVFLIHSGGGGLRSLSSWANKIVDFGKYGVISFFVLSAFTLAMSIARHKDFSYRHYLIRRFARIFPMYCLAIILFWLLGGIDAYQKMFAISHGDLVDLFMHLTFLNLWDVRYQNTILGVEWTVPIEMWTYLVIPPLFFFLGRIRSAWQWVVFVFAILVSTKSNWWHQDQLGAHWAVETYLYCFIGGLLAFSYRDKIKLSALEADVASASLLVAILCLCLFFGGRAAPILTLLIMGLILSLFNAQKIRLIFENRAIVMLGNISFSFYLLHYPILRFLSETLGDSLPIIFIAGLVSTTFAAYFCHQFIEKPALKLTGKLNPYDR